MELTTSITKRSAGKTFLVSVGVIALIAVLELGAIAWAFIGRFQASIASANALGVNSSGPSLELDSQQLQPQNLSLPFPGQKEGSSSSQKLPVQNPLGIATQAAPQETPDSGMPKPTPVPMARRIPASPQNRATELVAQARALRDRGDTVTALTRLREAQAVAPENPEIISEMAMIYEKMSLPQKARDHWRRIFQMGESAGIYYSAAEAKLRDDVANQAAPATSAGPAKQEFQPGAMLGMAEITRQEIVDPSALTKFTLKIPVKSRGGSPIDVHEVVIQVFFYDLLEDRSVVQTNANVNSVWTTAPTDWAEDNMEILEVEYSLPRPDVRSGPIENRKFYGYVARIYYKKDLQDMRAEPVKLLQQFPPPVSLQAEGTR